MLYIRQGAQLASLATTTLRQGLEEPAAPWDGSQAAAHTPDLSLTHNAS